MARFLPRPGRTTALPAIPPAELWLRLGAALALAAAILFGAAALGPTLSGILLSMPVTGSIMPPFTLAHYGPDALARLQRGFITGLTGFVAFFFVVSATVVALGTVASFSLATAAAVATVTVASNAGRWKARSARG
jgi:hypothetical protein